MFLLELFSFFEKFKQGVDPNDISSVMHSPNYMMSSNNTNPNNGLTNVTGAGNYHFEDDGTQASRPPRN